MSIRRVHDNAARTGELSAVVCMPLAPEIVNVAPTTVEIGMGATA